MSRRLTLLGIGLLLVVAVGTAAWAALTDLYYSGRPLPGVTVAGRPVGGMSPDDLAARVQTLAGPVLARQVRVRAATAEATLAAGTLGLRPAVDRTVAAVLAAGRTGTLPQRWLQHLALLRRPVDVPITYRVDLDAVRASAAGVAAPLLIEPRDAVVAVFGWRLVVLHPSQDGVVLDESASIARVATALEQRLFEVELVVTLRRPAFTTEMADLMAEPLAQFTTRFSNNPDRVHNIQLASAALGGLLLPPEAVLSFNQVVGPRDPARGYRKAPVLVRNELVPGDGGGVCQVSSTLYNAALLAGMEVQSRTNHSRPVPYLAPGRDAAVEFGLIDLRVRNSSGHHMLVWTEATGRRVTVALFGARQPGRSVEIAVTDHTPIPPPTHTVTRLDPTLPAGQTKIEQARSGLRARTLRIVRQDGAVIQQEVVSLSYYQPTPRTVKIGTGTGGADKRASAPVLVQIDPKHPD